MRRLITVLTVFALCVPLASYAAYTEVPPFSATEFANKRGVFRWYRGCWWKVVDPNVYLFCNNDGTIYLLLPDGTLRQILRENAEKIGLDDSGSRLFDPVKTKEDLRRIAYRYTVAPQSVLTRYRNRATYSTRFNNAYSSSFETYDSSYNGDGTGVTRYNDGGYFGGSVGGTGIFSTNSSGFSGGSFGGVGSFGGSSYDGGGSYGGGFYGGTYGGGSSVGGGGSLFGGGSTSGSFGGGGSTSGTTSGSAGGSSGGGGDPDDFLNKPLNIACSSKDDIVDGGIFGPIPCTWFPDVFGPVPDYWGE